MKKTHGLLLVLTTLLLAGIFLLKPTIERWMMSVPVTAFDQTPLPAAPDYSQSSYWAALPDRADSADWVPYGSGFVDEQQTSSVDVFYVHPTAAFYGDGWVAGFDNWLHRAAVDFGILPQQASPFNGAGRIYAPRYRSVRMPIWSATDKSSVSKAVELAYRRMFGNLKHYMAHYNRGPSNVIIASHGWDAAHHSFAA